jgi:hypothetical protein
LHQQLLELKYHIFGSIGAFVDTGSPWTVISQKDAEKLNIPFHIFRSQTPRIIYLGGKPLNGYTIQNVHLKFMSEQKQSIDITIPSIYVLYASGKDRKSLQLSKSLPSILRVDFLIDNKFALYFDPCNRQSFLEKK